MTNNRVSADGGAMPSALPRRTFLADTIAMAALPAAKAAAKPVALEALINEHLRAHAAFEHACERLWEIEAAYTKAYSEPLIVRSLLGGGYGLQNGEKDCRANIIAWYDNQRRNLTHIRRIAPELADQVGQALDAKQAENMELVTRAFAEEAERRSVFGLTAAEKEHQRADDAEDMAALAVCAYPCASIEEARRKAEYLTSGPRFEACELTEDLAAALVRSFLGGDGADA